jgi:hypothetical protein
MKTIKFNEKEYQVPECWSECTLKMIVKSGELDEILPDAPLVSIISAYTGIPVKELTTSKQSEVEEILKILEFIYTPYKPEINNEFEFQGEKYSAEEDLSNQSFGDFVSVETILYNYKDKPLQGLPRMIAVLCKKDGESLEDINIDERAKLFADLPLTIAKDVEGFFLVSQISYNAISQLSLTIPDMEKSIQLQLIELKRIIKARKVHIGGFSLMKLQIGYYQIYLWYLTKLWERYFNSTRTEISRKTWMQMLKNYFTKLFKRRKSK